MRKLRKFVTLGGYHPSIHIEGVVTPHDFSPFSRLFGGRNHPLPPSFSSWGEGASPLLFPPVAAVGAGNWRKPLFPVVGATGKGGTLLGGE